MFVRGKLVASGQVLSTFNLEINQSLVSLLSPFWWVSCDGEGLQGSDPTVLGMEELIPAWPRGASNPEPSPG